MSSPAWRRRHARAHWGLLALCLIVAFVLVAIQGLTTHTSGSGATPLARPGAVRALPDDVSVLTGSDLTGPRPPRRRIALTFDDGPDPQWTPRIAAVLRRLHVPATFFVVGANVARHPGIVASLHRDGFELGSHTFTHAPLTALSPSMLSLQLNLTDSAVTAAAGVRPRLLRPPYTSTTDTITQPDADALRAVVDRGYVVALSDFDSRDWERPGVARIVHAATPHRGRGGIVLMQDGGGNRAQTIAALERLVPWLRRHGYQFDTVSGLAGLSRADVEVPVSGLTRTRARGLLAALAASRALTSALIALLGAAIVLTLARALILLGFARHHARRRRPAPRFTPPVSVVMPAYNERVGIERAVRSLAASEYPAFEIVVVDDGSTDDTADIVEGLDLPGVRLLRQANAGKAAALNRGVAAAGHDVLVMVDADTVFERSALAELVAPLHDPHVGAVAGNAKVGNRRRLLGLWQHIEYVMGFNLDRRLYGTLRCTATVRGAIGAFRRAALDEVGGASEATLAEDTDLTIAIGRAGWDVVYAEYARAWTEAPSSVKSLWRQRYRWSYGTLQAVWKHRRALVHLRDPAERRIALVVLPYVVLFQVVLPVTALVIDPLVIYALVFGSAGPIVVMWLGVNFVQVAIAAYAFRLDGESLRPLWAVPLQQFVYRQLAYLVVAASVVSALDGRRLPWHHLERTGDVELVGEG